MEITAVEKSEIDFCKEYRSALRLKYRVRLSQEEAFGNERFTAERYGRVSGAYLSSRGIVVIAAANIRSESHLRGTLKHEIIGHFGLNTLEPRQKAKLLTAIGLSQSEGRAKEEPRIYGKELLICTVNNHYPSYPRRFLHFLAKATR